MKLAVRARRGRAPARQSPARHVSARFGTAGKAERGKVWQGRARQDCDMARMVSGGFSADESVMAGQGRPGRAGTVRPVFARLRSDRPG